MSSCQTHSNFALRFRSLSRIVAGVLLIALSCSREVSAQFSGPLRVNPLNPRYFTDNTGRAILLAGSHTWASVFDQGGSDPPPTFNITQFLDFLQSYGHNFTRTFVWEQSRWGTWTLDDNYWFHPGPPYKRTGPGMAEDGKPKFNLDSLDQSYFDWIRERVDSLQSRGIYASIMFFDGWSLFARNGLGNPWRGHPFNALNNVNGINGDPGGTGGGQLTHSLSIPELWPIQVRYIKKLIDELNGFDNVLWEVSNESSYNGSDVWEQRIMDTVRAYEAGKPKQHPIGFTADWYAPLLNPTVFASNADWVSPGAGNNGNVWQIDPPDSGGRKVVINDTDHLWGNGGDESWVWKTFCRGNNILYMDGYDGAAYGTGHPWSPADSARLEIVSLRKNIGYALRYANRMDLVNMRPQGSLSSTTYCLQGGTEWLVYQPGSGPFTVNLSSTQDSLNVEWLNPQSGTVITGARIAGGTSNTTMTPPFGGDAILYLLAEPPAVPAPPLLEAPPNGADGVVTTPTLMWSASGAMSYRLQVSADSMFVAPVVDHSGIRTISQTVTGLATNARYFWRVNAVNAAGTSEYSTVWRFTTGPPFTPPEVPILASPANGATEVSTTPRLLWNASSEATSYRVQVSADSGFGTTVLNESTLTTTSIGVSSLTTGTTYFWRVNATGSGGTSVFSATWRFSTVTIPMGLVAAYDFDEGSGTTVTDASGHGLTGTIVGATWTTQGRYGNALSFDGTSSYVDLGNPPSLQITGSMTWSAWVKAMADPVDDGQIIAKSDDNSGWQFKTSPDTGPHTFAVAASAAGIPHTHRYSTTIRSLNTWYHVAGVYDASNQILDIYVNGVLDNGPLVGIIPSPQFNAGVNANIGRRTGGYYFNGIIDDVRIYNRALAQSEIQADMNTPLGTLTQPRICAAAKVFLEGAYDSSAGLMNNALRTNGILAAHFSGRAIPAQAVDSVTIEIRNAASASGSTTRKFEPAWLLRDGTITSFTDTVKNYVEFDTSEGSYYLVVWHRNHLPVMTSTAKHLQPALSGVIDFTASQAQAYGVSPMRQIGSKFAMPGGDADTNLGIGATDLVTARKGLGTTGYLNNDIDMNGIVNTGDLSLCLQNVGYASQVPP